MATLHVRRSPWTNVAAVAALCCLIVLASPARAAEPIRLVKDIGDEVTGSNIRRLATQAGDHLFFAATTLSEGEELWKTDGTSEGTVLVKDLDPGSASSRPFALASLNETLLFFTYRTALSPPGVFFLLWKSDGTEAGTLPIAEFGPRGSPAHLYGPKFVGVANDLVFYAVYEEGYGYELWRSDGTEDGTFLVKDIVPGRYGSLQIGSSPVPAAEVGGLLFFAAGSNSGVLYKTDGTEEGTVAIKDFHPNGATRPLQHFVEVGGVLYFSGEFCLEDEDEQTVECSGKELWRSDGTEAGTVMVRDIAPGEDGSGPVDLASLQGALFFQAFGSEVWKSDGTEAGTVLVKRIQAAAPSSSRPGHFVESGGTIFFYAAGVEGGELWKTDGTEANTLLVKDIYPGDSSALYWSTRGALSDLDGKLLFFATDGVHGCELWTSDGTEEGTELVRDIHPGPSQSCRSSYPAVAGIPRLNGAVVFSANDGAHGVELWKSDGTEDGTLLVHDISYGTVGSGAKPLTVLNEELIFLASTVETGSELWKTDGTTGGTVLIEEIHPEGSPEPKNLKLLHGKLYFSAEDGTHGREPWTTDGTEAGTYIVKDINPDGDSHPGEADVLDGKLYYGAYDGTRGAGLWASDGTEAGTVLVQAIGSFIDHQGVLGGKLHFAANNGIHGNELWSSDGTDAGTALVRDINPFNPEGGTFPTEVLVLNGRFYFAADDGTHGKELWSSDGTEAGTIMVKDIHPEGSSNPWLAEVTEDKIYFAAVDGTHGGELWVTDGTEAGTRLVKDMNPEGGSGFFFGSYVSGDFEYGRLYTAVIGSRMFFAADDGTHGWELWVTDGTESGTYLVKDITAEPPGRAIPYVPEALTAAGDKLFFFKDDGVHGKELWVSDGTEAGTTMLRDIHPGPAFGVPEDVRFMYALDGAVLLAADDGRHGLEPWASDGTEQGTYLIQDVMLGPGSSLWSWLLGPPGHWVFGPGDEVFLSAQTEEHGEELHALDLCALFELSVLDADNDRLWDGCDNCPDSANPNQDDFDLDGVGDACESGAVLADANQSNRVDGFDLAALSRALGSQCSQERYAAAVDFNRDCWVDGKDVDLLRPHFGATTE